MRAGMLRLVTCAIGVTSLTGCSSGTCTRTIHHEISAGKKPLAMWIAPSSDVYIVGGAGLTERNATILSVAGGGNFQSVWGSSTSDLYAVGDGGVFHWNGVDSWTVQVPTGADYRAVSGADAQHVWAVGETSIVRGSGSILFSSGDGTWSPAASAMPLLTNLWVASASDVYVVGVAGTVVHLISGTWRTESIGISDAVLRAVWGSSGSDVYAVGYNSAGGLIAHSIGDGMWTTTSVNALDLTSVWGSSPSDVHVGGVRSGPTCLLLRLDGNSWVNDATAPCSNGILQGSSIDQQRVTVLQDDGNVSTRTGTLWSQFDATVPAVSYDSTVTASLEGFDGKCPLDAMGIR